MSLAEEVQEVNVRQGKRKRQVETDELEINVDAPEPPSKKALRKAKKAESKKPTNHSKEDGKEVEENVEEESVKNTRSQYGIWIGNLSFATTKAELLSFLTSDLDNVIEAANITRIYLPAGPPRNSKPQNKGFAYVDFADNDSLTKGLELSEKLLGGRRVLIKNAKSFEGRPTHTSDGKISEGKAPNKRIFVGNLPFDTDVEALENHFEICGSIQNTHVATFEDSGKCKGYAWIEFEDISSAQAAMRGWVEQSRRLAGEGPITSKRRVWLQTLDGRKLRMEYAEDATTRYNKRYGKNAGDKEQASIPENGDGFQETKEDDRRKGGRTEVSTDFRSMKSDEGKKRRKGYEDKTVKRLTGAIVESKGQKIEFD